MLKLHVAVSLVTATIFLGSGPAPWSPLAVNAQATNACAGRKDGDQVRDDKYCDRYHVCNGKGGISSSNWCPDGLVFDEFTRKANRCDQIFNVDCEQRIELQPPKGNEKCPRRNGYFAHMNPAVCYKYYNCIDGRATESVCPIGLHFDEYTGTCAWPAEAGREGCKEEVKPSLNGFTCPGLAAAATGPTRGGVPREVHTRHAHPTDCQKFYLCLHGTEARELSCDWGLVFDEETSQCDTPDGSARCHDWYRDTDEGPTRPRGASPSAPVTSSSSSGGSIGLAPRVTTSGIRRNAP